MFHNILGADLSLAAKRKISQRQRKLYSTKATQTMDCYFTAPVKSPPNSPNVTSGSPGPPSGKKTGSSSGSNSPSTKKTVRIKESSKLPNKEEYRPHTYSINSDSDKKPHSPKLKTQFSGSITNGCSSEGSKYSDTTGQHSSSSGSSSKSTYQSKPLTKSTSLRENVKPAQLTKSISLREPAKPPLTITKSSSLRDSPYSSPKLPQCSKTRTDHKETDFPVHEISGCSSSGIKRTLSNKDEDADSENRAGRAEEVGTDTVSIHKKHFIYL